MVRHRRAAHHASCIASLLADTVAAAFRSCGCRAGPSHFAPTFAQAVSSRLRSLLPGSRLASAVSSNRDYVDAAATGAPLPKQYPRLGALQRAGWLVLSLPFTPSNLRLGYGQDIDGGIVVPDYAVPDGTVVRQALENRRILPQLAAALCDRLASQPTPVTSVEVQDEAAAQLKPAVAVSLPLVAATPATVPVPVVAPLASNAIAPGPARARLAQYFKGGQAAPPAGLTDTGPQR